ncbi:MAG: sialate O-acetylesterase, partial [Planctomycetota bacterium]
MRCSPTRSAFTFAVLLLLAPVAAAEGLSIDAPWGDGMVIQRGEPVTVRGAAGPGETVVVAFAGKKRKATADGDGRWTVSFDAVKPGPARRLTVETGSGGRIEVRDILAGDVWICSGQSNMAWTVGKSKDATKEIAAAKYSKIRLYTVPRRPMVRPAPMAHQTWHACSPKTVGGFSAVGYYFGRELAKELRVPIGLINTSYGGTPAEAWTRREALPPGRLRQRHREMLASKKAGARLPSCLWNGMVHAL